MLKNASKRILRTTDITTRLKEHLIFPKCKNLLIYRFAIFLYCLVYLLFGYSKLFIAHLWHKLLAELTVISEACFCAVSVGTRQNKPPAVSERRSNIALSHTVPVTSVTKVHVPSHLPLLLLFLPCSTSYTPLKKEQQVQ